MPSSSMSCTVVRAKSTPEARDANFVFRNSLHMTSSQEPGTQNRVHVTSPFLAFGHWHHCWVLRLCSRSWSELLCTRRPLQTNALSHTPDCFFAWPATEIQLCLCSSLVDLVLVKSSCAHTSEHPQTASTHTGSCRPSRSRVFSVCDT